MPAAVRTRTPTILTRHVGEGKTRHARRHSAGLVVRDSPDSDASSVGIIAWNGRGLEALPEQRQVDGQMWKKVRYTLQGWVNGSYLRPSSSPDRDSPVMGYRSSPPR